MNNKNIPWYGGCTSVWQTLGVCLFTPGGTQNVGSSVFDTGLPAPRFNDLELPATESTLYGITPTSASWLYEKWRRKKK